MYTSEIEVRYPQAAMADPPIKFSLIVATVERSRELTRLLESLKRQSYRNFEVVLVDQNPPGFLTAVTAPFLSCFPILHLRSRIGLSRARNIALGHITGNVVGFPDDDCWYPSDALERIAGLFAANPAWGGLTVRPAEPENPDSFGWYHRTSGSVDLMNLWRRSISFTIFLRCEAVRAAGEFDEDLGLGTTTGMLASEESEYLIRVLKQGFNLHYHPEIRVYHPALPAYDGPRIARAYGEGRAFGYVLRKYGYPLSFVARTWVRALGGAAQSLLLGKWTRTRYYWLLFRGRLHGWFVDSHRIAAIGGMAADSTVRRREHHAE